MQNTFEFDCPERTRRPLKIVQPIAATRSRARADSSRPPGTLGELFRLAGSGIANRLQAGCKGTAATLTARFRAGVFTASIAAAKALSEGITLSRMARRLAVEGCHASPTAQRISRRERSRPESGYLDAGCEPPRECACTTKQSNRTNLVSKVRGQVTGDGSRGENEETRCQGKGVSGG